MILGLKRGTVALFPHDPEWGNLASETIARLWNILGNVAHDIQHVGSTSIIAIKAKPIIDIAVAVSDFDEVMALIPILKENGFFYREWHGHQQLLFACGDYSVTDDRIYTQTHFIHVTKADGTEWHNYINFRDYMNAHISEAKEYESLKIRLANENPIDAKREKYTAGKHDYIAEKLLLAKLWNDSGCKSTHTKPLKNN